MSERKTMSPEVRQRIAEKLARVRREYEGRRVALDAVYDEAFWKVTAWLDWDCGREELDQSLVESGDGVYDVEGA